MTDAAIVIPYRDNGCPHRRAARVRVRDHLAMAVPNVAVIEADDPHPRFSRAAALNAGFRQTDAAVVLTMDADVLLPEASIRLALAMARDPGLVIPYDCLVYVHEPETTVILADPAPPVNPSGWRWSPCAKTPLVGGAGALSRHTWRTARGWVDGFRGWGCQDIAFEVQCSTLVAPTRRIPGDLVHLFHPKGGHYTAPPVLAANRARLAAIRHAAGDPRALGNLLDTLTEAPA